MSISCQDAEAIQLTLAQSKRLQSYSQVIKKKTKKQTTKNTPHKPQKNPKQNQHAWARESHLLQNFFLFC